MLKILQARLQQYMNRELPDVQARLGKARVTRDQIVNICWIIKKTREFQKNIYFCFIDYVKAVDCVDHNKLWNILFFFNYLFILLYNFVWFCHTLTWIHHGCTCVPHPKPPSHPIPLGHPSAPAPSILYDASKLDRWFISHMIIYMFQCPSPISSYPCPLPQSPKDCSIHLCLSCCLAYRVIVTIFLNSIYMH